MRIFKSVNRGVAAECRDQRHAAFFEQLFNHKGIAADIIFTEQIDAVFRSAFNLVISPDNMRKQPVIGDMMPGGLADAFIAFATKRKDVNAEFFLHLASDGMHVVANQPDGTGRKDGNGFRLENVVGFLNRLAQFLFAAENDLLFLHVGRKAVGHEVMPIRRCLRVRLIAARQPTIKAAADWSVRNIDNVPRRPQHDALAARIGAAALRDDARRRSDVRLHFRDFQFLIY